MKTKHMAEGENSDLYKCVPTHTHTHLSLTHMDNGYNFKKTKENELPLEEFPHFSIIKYGQNS